VHIAGLTVAKYRTNHDLNPCFVNKRDTQTPLLNFPNEL